MRITRRPAADSDLERIYAWVAMDDPDAAERLVRRIVDAALRLADFPESGPARPDIGRNVGTLTIGNYLILYEILRDSVDIVRVVHGARELSALLAPGTDAE